MWALPLSKERRTEVAGIEEAGTVMTSSYSGSHIFSFGPKVKNIFCTEFVYKYFASEPINFYCLHYTCRQSLLLYGKQKV